MKTPRSAVGKHFRSIGFVQLIGRNSFSSPSNELENDFIICHLAHIKSSAQNKRQENHCESQRCRFLL